MLILTNFTQTIGFQITDDTHKSWKSVGNIRYFFYVHHVLEKFTLRGMHLRLFPIKLFTLFYGLHLRLFPIKSTFSCFRHSGGRLLTWGRILPIPLLPKLCHPRWQRLGTKGGDFLISQVKRGLWHKAMWFLGRHNSLEGSFGFMNASAYFLSALCLQNIGIWMQTWKV